jgi:ABC-type uncharacterized transport system permease subunit
MMRAIVGFILAAIFVWSAIAPWLDGADLCLIRAVVVSIRLA